MECLKEERKEGDCLSEAGRESVSRREGEVESE